MRGLAGRPLFPLRLRFRRVSPGVYDSADGRLTLYQIPGCSPPAWNVELTIEYGNALIDLAPEAPAPKETHSLIVDGAATKRDALALAHDAWPVLRTRLASLERVGDCRDREARASARAAELRALGNEEHARDYDQMASAARASAREAALTVSP